MKVVKKVLKYLLYGVLGSFIALCVYILIATTIFKEEYVNIFGYTYFQVETGSMSGTIEENDLVIVKLTDHYQVNDIITFKEQGTYITHRLIGKEGGSLLTRGDVNNAEDEPVKPNQVLGKVVYVISTTTMLQVLGILIILFIILTLINFESVFKKWVVREERPLRKRRREVESGNTIQIPLDEILKMEQEKKQKECTPEEQKKLEVTLIELLDDFTREIDDFDVDRIKEQDFLNQVLKLLKVKNKDLKTTKLNHAWAQKFAYVYKIANILRLDDQLELSTTIATPPFSELYDYEFEEVGLSQALQDKLYDMPLYVFIKILIFTILYSDEEFFDAVFKIFKYKVKVDKNHLFTSLAKKTKKVRTLEEAELENEIQFMNQISHDYHCEETLGLTKISEYVEITKKINET